MESRPAVCKISVLLFLHFQGMKDCQKTLIALLGVMELSVFANDQQPLLLSCSTLNQSDVNYLKNRNH